MSEPTAEIRDAGEVWAEQVGGFRDAVQTAMDGRGYPRQQLVLVDDQDHVDRPVTGPNLCTGKGSA